MINWGLTIDSFINNACRFLIDLIVDTDIHTDIHYFQLLEKADEGDGSC